MKLIINLQTLESLLQISTAIVALFQKQWAIKSLSKRALMQKSYLQNMGSSENENVSDNKNQIMCEHFTHNNIFEKKLKEN